MNGAPSTEMDPDFVTRVDVDGNGDLDWIVDGHKVWCEKAGKRVPAADGPTGTALWIVLDTPEGPKMLDQIDQDTGVIRRHANFATIFFEEGAKLQIRGIRITEIGRVPPGGTAVFEMRR